MAVAGVALGGAAAGARPAPPPSRVAPRGAGHLFGVGGKEAEEEAEEEERGSGIVYGAAGGGKEASDSEDSGEEVEESGYKPSCERTEDSD